mgnify:CR=1 FL=1
MIGERPGLVATIVLAALLGATRSGWAEEPVAVARVIARNHSAMGTLVTLTAWTTDEPAAIAAFGEAFAEIDRIESVMTTWRADSEVSRINAAAGGKPVAVSTEVIEVLEKAAWASRLSGGAFDVTIGAFAGVWKFDEDRDGTIPDPALVAARKKLLGWRDVEVEPHAKTVRLRRPGQRIGLGGIAKGYAVDKAAAVLHRRGVESFVIKAGGDLFVSGRRGDRPWRVGIRDPRGPEDSYFAFAEVEDRTFSTSGDYERYVIKDGKRYHHILDPATGYPAWRTRSVTVLAKDALTADSLSKGLFILGPERGMELVEKLPDIEAIFVGPDNRVSVSSGLVGKLTIVQPPTDGL